MDRLLATKDVADFLGLADETILSWAERGVLKGFRLPHGPLRFRREDVEAWLESQRVGPVERPFLQAIEEGD